VLIDERGQVVTERRRPRFTHAAAELLPGGGVRLSRPGTDPLNVPVSRTVGAAPVEIFRDKVERSAPRTTPPMPDAAPASAPMCASR
jgi:uncharacterized protein YcbX